MKNEILFNQLCSKDLNELNELIRKGYFETSVFEEKLLRVADSLAVLHQVITIERGKYDCEENRKVSLQAS